MGLHLRSQTFHKSGFPFISKAYRLVFTSLAKPASPGRMLTSLGKKIPQSVCLAVVSLATSLKSPVSFPCPSPDEGQRRERGKSQVLSQEALLAA